MLIVHTSGCQQLGEIPSCFVRPTVRLLTPCMKVFLRLLPTVHDFWLPSLIEVWWQYFDCCTWSTTYYMACVTSLYKYDTCYKLWECNQSVCTFVPSTVVFWIKIINTLKWMGDYQYIRLFRIILFFALHIPVTQHRWLTQLMHHTLV